MHRMPLRVERPAMRNNRLVRRAIVRGDADHQRRIKPAPKLIATFDVNIRGPAQFGTVLEHSN